MHSRSELCPLGPRIAQHAVPLRACLTPHSHPAVPRTPGLSPHRSHAPRSALPPSQLHAKVSYTVHLILVYYRALSLSSCRALTSPHVERHRTTRRHAPRKEEETQPDGRHASVSRHAARQRTEADAHAASPYSREHRVRREPWVSAFNTRAGGWVRQDGVPAACRTRRTGCPAHALCVRVLDDRACAAEKWRHRQHSRVGSQDRMARHTWKHRVPPAWRPRPLASQSRRPVCF